MGNEHVPVMPTPPIPSQNDLFSAIRMETKPKIWFILVSDFRQRSTWSPGPCRRPCIRRRRSLTKRDGGSRSRPDSTGSVGGFAFWMFKGLGELIQLSLRHAERQPRCAPMGEGALHL